MRNQHYPTCVGTRLARCCRSLNRRHEPSRQPTNNIHLEQITYDETFDGFPMFSPDGRSLVFASNRNAETDGDTNVFIADWNE